MAARGGANQNGAAAANEPYCTAYKCRTTGCKGYRWADVAECNGETRCIVCNALFPKVPVRMPFHRKGPPSTHRGKGAASADTGGKGGDKSGQNGPKTPGLQGEPKAKAKPKAKPKWAPW